MWIPLPGLAAIQATGLIVGTAASQVAGFKESPVNNPLAACGHCAKLAPQPEMVCAADGRLFCSVTCRAAAEIFDEWQEG